MSPCVEVAGNWLTCSGLGWLPHRRSYPRQDSCLRPSSSAISSHSHRRAEHCFCTVRLSTSFFNLAVHGEVPLAGRRFSGCLCRFFFSARQRFVACQLLHHLLINNRFQLRSDDFPAIHSFYCPAALCSGDIAFPTGLLMLIRACTRSFHLIFPPAMYGWLSTWDFHVVHQLLAAGQPDVGGDNASWGSQHQHFIFQVVLLLGFTSRPLIQIAAIPCR